MSIIMPTFIGSRGRIFHDSWQPDGAVRGAVVLLHGYGEHSGAGRSTRPAYCTSGPLNAIGAARNRVSRAGQSKPSPM